jgi:hypothetical protein
MEFVLRKNPKPQPPQPTVDEFRPLTWFLFGIGTTMTAVTITSYAMMLAIYNRKCEK